MVPVSFVGDTRPGDTGDFVTRFQIFFIRAVLGAAFGVLIARFFFPHASILAAAALGALLVGLAYVSEYFRKRKKG